MNSNQLYVPCSLLFSKYYKLTISVTYMYMVATGYIQVDGPLYCLFYELFLVIICVYISTYFIFYAFPISSEKCVFSIGIKPLHTYDNIVIFDRN